jgi:hypothetical protein
MYKVKDLINDLSKYDPETNLRIEGSVDHGRGCSGDMNCGFHVSECEEGECEEDEDWSGVVLNIDIDPEDEQWGFDQ